MALLGIESAVADAVGGLHCSGACSGATADQALARWAFYSRAVHTAVCRVGAGDHGLLQLLQPAGILRDSGAARRSAAAGRMAGAGICFSAGERGAAQRKNFIDRVAGDWRS